MTVVEAIHPNMAVSIEFWLYSLIMRAVTEDCYIQGHISPKHVTLKKRKAKISSVAMKCAAKTSMETISVG